MTDDAPGPAIRIEALTKRYGRLRAVDDLSLEVSRGEIFGFLGLNGAGKSTTIRILLDLRRPTSGRAQIDGHDCQREGLAVRSRVGHLPGELGLPGDMTGRGVLDLLARLGGRAVEDGVRRTLLERMELAESDLDRRLRDYSTGMRRKLGVVQAFQSRPSVLVLDEPTEGLDPIAQEAFSSLLFEARERGATVFLSSHVLSEVERLCDRVAVIRDGRLAVMATVAEITGQAKRRVSITFSREVEFRPEAAPGCDLVSASPRAWTLLARGETGPLVRALAGWPVADLEVREVRLEDVLIRYYRGDDR